MMMAILLPSARGRLRRLRGDLVVCCWRLSLERPTTGEWPVVSYVEDDKVTGPGHPSRRCCAMGTPLGPQYTVD